MRLPDRAANPWEPHYPTSAELAAFRRTFPRPLGSTEWRAIASDNGAPTIAFADERAHGIGATEARSLSHTFYAERGMAVFGPEYRHEAARMRHAAYVAMARDSVGLPIHANGVDAAWSWERRDGIPRNA